MGQDFTFYNVTQKKVSEDDSYRKFHYVSYEDMITVFRNTIMSNDWEYTDIIAAYDIFYDMFVYDKGVVSKNPSNYKEISECCVDISD